MNESRPLPRLRRDRWFPVVTVVVAAIWTVSAWKVADYVKSVNSARVIGAIFTANMHSNQATSFPSNTRPSFSSMLFPRPPQNEQARQTALQIRKQTAYVEIIVQVWQWIMYGIAGLLAAAGIVSLIKPWARGLHLAAGIVILLSTVMTLIAMHWLIAGDKGGLPPLSIWSYLIVAAIQSCYGWILIFAFARKPHRAAISLIDPTA